MSEADIIDDALQRVMDAVPELTREMAWKIEEQLRRDWGGSDISVKKRGAAWRAKKEKARELIGIKSTKELQDETGLSRSTLYRCIGKGGK
jgi:hypothetical protein